MEHVAPRELLLHLAPDPLLLGFRKAVEDVLVEPGPVAVPEADLSVEEEAVARPRFDDLPVALTLAPRP